MRGVVGLWPLSSSKSRQALVARGWPVNGVPSVMTQRASSGMLLGELARVDAAQAPADQADRLAVRVGERAHAVAQRSSTPSRGPRLKPWPQACVT